MLVDKNILLGMVMIAIYVDDCLTLETEPWDRRRNQRNYSCVERA
jgi:hypothetical protein